MSEHPELLNVRSLAVIMTAAPLSLLLVFSAIDLSWTNLSQHQTPTKNTAEMVPKVQQAKNSFDR